MSNPFEKARSESTDAGRENLLLVERLFEHLEAMNFDAVAELFHDQGLYRDEPNHDLDAVGPTAIAAKLDNGISGLKAFPMCVESIVADANRVMSVRAEEWHFPTGERLKLPVMAVHEIRDGKIDSWREFWDMSSFISQMPPSWMEVITQRAAAAAEG